MFKLALVLVTLLGLAPTTIFAQSVRASSQLGKVSVNVADLLSRQTKQTSPKSVAKIVVGRYERAMGDAPPMQPQLHSSGWSPNKVDVKVAGQKIDTASLTLTPPNPSNELNRKLRIVLGRNFDNQWMSIEALDNANHSVPHGYPKSDESLQAALNSLNFTRGEMDTHTTDALKSWLLQRATCPIEFVWEDLGPTFWPQFIRHGHCQSGHSCSWPSGMSCRQSGSRKLNMLRWVSDR
ncbi:hypothetical protein Ciccas_014130 [Cichlidogyrus casuarinus]|uniref:Noggin n=1 Tax=Cichlidogyrus casuarinus TaxID=1844966 RepID=A0ABD2PJV8_9PLAT